MYGLCRYKLEHNQISRSEVDKGEIFELLNLHLEDPDQEIQHTALQLIQVSSPALHISCCFESRHPIVMYRPILSSMRIGAT